MQPTSVRAAATLDAATPTTSPTAGHGVPFTNSSAPARQPAGYLPPDRRGRLKNGVPGGDFLAAPRCGARTRSHGSCRQPAMGNGRCRFHGGKSTGPRTAGGMERCRLASRTHGGCTAEVRALMAAATIRVRRMCALFALIGRSPLATAGYGVPRQKLRSRAGAGAKQAANKPANRAARLGSARLAAGSRRDRLCSSTAIGVVQFSAGHGVPPQFFDEPAGAERLDGVAA